MVPVNLYSHSFEDMITETVILLIYNGLVLYLVMSAARFIGLVLYVDISEARFIGLSSVFCNRIVNLLDKDIYEIPVSVPDILDTLY